MSSVSILLDRECGKHGRPKKKEQFCCSAGNLFELAEDKAATYKLEEMPCNLPSSAKSTFLITFSRDGLKVASACSDHNVWVCDVRTGKILKTLKGHPRTPWCLTFHPTSNDILASGCLGGEVRVWDLHGGSEVWVVEQKQPITSLTFHPTDKVLVIATLNQLHFWDWSLPTPFATCETNSDKEKVRYVKFDNQGTRLITGITNVPPESQRSHESIFGLVNFPRSTSSRGSLSAQRTSILNRLMNLYSHLEGLEEISRYTGSNASDSGSSGRSGALSPTQDDALQRARLYAEEISIQNAHLYRQRLYNLDQALGLPSDLGEDPAFSRFGPGRAPVRGRGLLNPSWSRRGAEPSPNTSDRRSDESNRTNPVTDDSPPVVTNTNLQEGQPANGSSSQEGAASAAAAVGSSNIGAASGRPGFFGYSSVNADFWVTFHRLRFICSSLERRIHHQPPPSLFHDMPPHLPSIPPEQFSSNVPVPEINPSTRNVLDYLLGPSTPSSSASTSQSTSSTSSTSGGTAANSLRNASNSNRPASETREGPSTPDVSVSLVSLLTRLQHSLQSLSNAALTTAVARDQIQQVRTRIAEILERLDNVSGYRARLTNLRDQIYEAADRMAQRGEDNTQTQRRDLAYCLWLVEMSLQLTRDMQRILATDYRLTQLHLNSSMPGTPLSASAATTRNPPSASASSAPVSNPTQSGDVSFPHLLSNQSSASISAPINLESLLSNTPDESSNASSSSEPAAPGNSNANTSNSSRTFRGRNSSSPQPNEESARSESVTQNCIFERINNLLTTGLSTSSNRPTGDSAFSNLPFFPNATSGNDSDDSHSLAQLASERLPNHFNLHRRSSAGESPPSIHFDSSPFFWRNQALRRRPSSSDNRESRAAVRLPTVPSLSSSSRSSPFEAPTRRVNLNVNSEHPPMNDASTSTTGRVSLRLANQGTGSLSNPVNQSRSSSRSSDRTHGCLGRGISSRVITSAIRPTRTAVARRRWLNYRMNMSPTSVRRRRLYRWSSQQPLSSAVSGGTQLVVNPRHNRQNYSDAGTSEGVHDQRLPRSVNRSSTTTDDANPSVGTRIARQIHNPSSPSTSGLGQPGVVESEILLNRLRTVHRERLAQPFTIPFVQVEPTNSPTDGELPPLPADQRPRSPPLSAILSRPTVNVLNRPPHEGPGGLSYLGIPSPRLAPAPPYWPHNFYDTGFRSRGMGPGFDSSHNVTYRIQCWDFSTYTLPNIAQSESCIVVPKCKINNDGSIDISKDGKFLAAFVPNIGNTRQSTMVAVYSLATQNIGQCLYTWNFENTNAMSVSFSPLARYLVIGIGAHRHHLTASEREPLAQIFRLDPFTKNSSLTFVSSVYQEGGSNTNSGSVRGLVGLGGAPALNYVRWLPESGQGLIYGTNKGSLLICRPVSSNSDSHYVSPYHLVSTSTQTIDQETSSSSTPEMQTTGTQTASSVQPNDSDDDDDDDDDE